MPRRAGAELEEGVDASGGAAANAAAPERRGDVAEEPSLGVESRNPNASSYARGSEYTLEGGRGGGGAAAEAASSRGPGEDAAEVARGERGGACHPVSCAERVEGPPPPRDARRGSAARDEARDGARSPRGRAANAAAKRAFARARRDIRPSAAPRMRSLGWGVESAPAADDALPSR